MNDDQPINNSTTERPTANGLARAATICLAIRDGETGFRPGSKTAEGIRLGADACLCAILGEMKENQHD